MGVNSVLDIVFGPWKKYFIEDFDRAWEKLMELDAKAVSVRQQMFKRLDDDIIDP